MLDSIFNESEYLTFYLKQFKLLINNKNILDYSKNKGIIYKSLKSLNCDVSNINDNINGVFSGIIVNNLDYTLDDELFSKLNELLFDDGKILIIMHTKKIDKIYDDEEDIEEIKSLKNEIKNYFAISHELIGDGAWKFIIIEKNTIK